MSGFNRRDFFKGLGATTLMLSSPEKLIMGSILDGVMNNARAAEGAVPGKNLINIFLPGGPPRWYFDLPIRPNGTDNIVDNKMVKTRFTLSGSKLIPEYDTFQVGNSFLPYLWKARIPTADGQTVPMGYLAMSAVFIRGYDMLNDSHTANIARHNAPISGNASLSGIFADNSNKPFPNIRTDQILDHKSDLGKSSVRIPLGSASPFSDLMSPFNLTTQQSFNRREAMNNAIKGLHSNISSLLGAKNPYTNFLLSERDSTIELYTKGVEGLSSKYSELFNKYRNLEVRSYTTPLLEGIDDLPIPIENDVNYSIDLGGRAIPTATTPVGDLRTVIDASTIFGDLAKSFAVAEYIITEGLSSSFMMNPTSLQGLNFGAELKYVMKETMAAVSGRQRTSFDAHNTGGATGLFLFSHIYRAFAACLYELTLQLKAKNIYNDTIIQLSAEFNRSASTDGSGSDHGFQGCGTSIYSGIFEGNIGSSTIGNVSINNSPAGGKKGTWGIAAKCTELGNRNILIGNIASTVTGLMGYESPTKNDSALIKIDGNGKVIPLLGTPKNV